MAPGSHQEEFTLAVSLGRTAAWRSLLESKRRDARFPLSINQCLLDAVKLGIPAAVEDVLKLRPSMNASDSAGDRPIHIAAKYGPAEIVQLLVQADSMLNCVNAEELSPLHIACQYSNLATAQVLLSEGASSSIARTDKLLTPIHVAIENGCGAMVELLLRNGADPNAKSGWSHGELTPLSLSVMKGNASVVEAVLTAGSQLVYAPDRCGNFPLHLAVQSDNPNILGLVLCGLALMVPSWNNPRGRESFIRQGASQRNPQEVQAMLNAADREGWSPLHLAIKHNQLDMVRFLLDAGADVNAVCKDMRPLELAIKCLQPLDAGNAETLPMDCAERRRRITQGEEWDDRLVTLLCERGADLENFTPSGLYPIHLALSSGLYDVARLICTKVPHAMDCSDSTGRTPLHLACKQKSTNQTARLELISKLLDIGLSVNARTWDKGISPLSCAIFDGNLEVVALLLEHTPDLSAVDVDGMSALHDAVIAQNVAVIEMLLAAGSDVNQRDTDSGQTPLILAATMGAMEVAQCLLNHGADLHYRENRLGYSALHRAINNFYRSPSRYVQMMELLIMSGADLGLVDGTGLTPLLMMLSMLVCRSGEQQVVQVGLDAVKLLVEAGSTLQPWTRTGEGVLRRTPLLSLTFTGQCCTVYYLANMGWPLTTELPPSSRSPAAHNDNQPRHVQPDWMRLPGKTVAQDSLHAYLLLRLANPFSLRDICRSAVRTCLKKVNQARRGDGRETEILTLIDGLPVPSLVRKYVSLRDRDYSSVEECWGKLLYLLPPGAMEAVADLCQSSANTG